MTLESKLQPFAALRPLSLESVASLVAAWDVAADRIRPAKFPKVIEGMADAIRRHAPKWDNFCKVVEGAMVACETSGHKASDHFPEVGKMIPLGKGEERSSVDCGSLLPLSATQPAASGSALARRSRTKPQSSAVDSRLSHGKLQQAVAVQSLRRPWIPDPFPGLRKLIPQFTFSTSHFSLTASHS